VLSLTLWARRYNVPLVADIHFQPQVAMMVADAFEKIRVNPGNFADGRKTFEVINYDDPAQFRAEQEQIREARAPEPRPPGPPGRCAAPRSSVFFICPSCRHCAEPVRAKVAPAARARAAAGRLRDGSARQRMAPTPNPVS
jgi:4-hydroxy-3-methylbut-2-en-1-yl diphosphate synthase IspG/GcpE